MPNEAISLCIHLTMREAQVLRMVSDGLSSKQIAIALGISSKTVETYIEHIRMKTGATNRAHMIMLAVANRLLVVDGEA